MAKSKAVLCAACVGSIVIRNIGKCSNFDCDNLTRSGAYKICETCAKQENKCQLCLNPLN